MAIYGRCKRISYVLTKLGMAFGNHANAQKTINIIEDISLDKGDVFFTVVIINLSELYLAFRYIRPSIVDL